MTYTDDFYTMEAGYASASAAIVIPWVLERTDSWTAIDIGCGTGEWALAAKNAGCAMVAGVDYQVPTDLLVIDVYVDRDLTSGFDCRGYELAICLEVAEHLPAGAAEPLVAGLAQSRTVLFSAATPGQPGIGHINCMPHDYWHNLFAAHGKTPTHIGPLFEEPVASFYRRNMFLYE